MFLEHVFVSWEYSLKVIDNIIPILECSECWLNVGSKLSDHSQNFSTETLFIHNSWNVFLMFFKCYYF